MKKHYFVYYSLIILVMLIFTACGNEANKPNGEISVYSFSGENDDISLINGVAIFGKDDDILNGGELILKTDKFKDIKYYNVKLYVKTEKSSLMSNASEIKNGTFSKEEIEGEVGSISNFMYNNITLEDFKNNLYFKLETVDKNDKKSEYEIHLKVNEITKN